MPAQPIGFAGASQTRLGRIDDCVMEQTGHGKQNRPPENQKSFRKRSGFLAAKTPKVPGSADVVDTAR